VLHLTAEHAEHYILICCHHHTPDTMEVGLVVATVELAVAAAATGELAVAVAATGELAVAAAAAAAAAAAKGLVAAWAGVVTATEGRMAALYHRG